MVPLSHTPSHNVLDWTNTCSSCALTQNILKPISNIKRLPISQPLPAYCLSLSSRQDKILKTISTSKHISLTQLNNQLNVITGSQLHAKPLLNFCTTCNSLKACTRHPNLCAQSLRNRCCCHFVGTFATVVATTATSTIAAAATAKS